MKLSFFIFPFINSCRQPASVISLKSSSKDLKDDFSKRSEKVVDCVLEAKYEESFHEYFMNESEWFMMLRLNCDSERFQNSVFFFKYSSIFETIKVCSIVNSLSCYKCFEQNLLSESAFDELCFYYNFEKCQYISDFRKFFRKGKNCLSRKLSLNKLIEEDSRKNEMLLDFEHVGEIQAPVKRNEIEIPEKDTYFRAFGKCIRVYENDLIEFLQISRFIKTSLENCKICAKKEEISNCAKCWKNSLSLSSEPFIGKIKKKIYSQKNNNFSLLPTFLQKLPKSKAKHVDTRNLGELLPSFFIDSTTFSEMH